MKDTQSGEIIRNGEVSLAEINALRVAVGWTPYQFTKRYDEVAAPRTFATFSIRENDELIAFARVISDGAFYAFIVDLNVHPAHQKKGIGMRFVKHIVSTLKDIKTIKVTFEPELESFYSACGFKISRGGTFTND